MPDVKPYVTPTLTRNGDVAVTVRLSFNKSVEKETHPHQNTITKRVICKVAQVEDAMFYYRQTCGYKLTYVEYLADEIYYLAPKHPDEKPEVPESGAVCEYYLDYERRNFSQVIRDADANDERLRELEPFSDANPEFREE